MNIQDAQARLDRAKADFEQALDKLGRIVIEARAEAMKQSWFRMAEVLDKVKEQDNKGAFN